MCSVDTAEVRPFWGRVVLSALLASVLIYGSLVLTVFGFLRQVGYPVTISMIGWPPSWSDINQSKSQYFLNNAQSAYNSGELGETDMLGQRTYFKTQPNGEVLQVTFYLAYWKPGQARVGVVATHTPDACWPGAGWTPQPTEVSEMELPLPTRNLSQAEYRVFTNESAPQHVWFWHSYDREVIPEFEQRRPLELLGSVFTYGVRSHGEQLFVRLSSNRPWEEFSDEPLMAEIFSRLSKYGI